MALSELDQPTDTSAEWDTQEAVRRKENALAKLRQLEYDIASGKVAEIEPMAQKVAARYSIIRSRLQGIGSKVAPLIAVIKHPEEVKAMIDREIDEALEELSRDRSGDE